MSCYQETEYRSFNDFFSRKIKPGARIFSPKETDLISPCDCYASAYRIDPALLCKYQRYDYSVASLLHSKKLAARYTGGTLLVLRLTVGDYHRYHYPVSGIQSKNHFIPGILHTVNPIANDYIPIYKENSREYTVTALLSLAMSHRWKSVPCWSARYATITSPAVFSAAKKKGIFNTAVRRSFSFLKRMLSHSVRILRKTPDKGMKPSFTLGTP